MKDTMVDSKKKLHVLSAKDFRSLFKLDESYKIPKSTLKQYSLYIKGCYLLYEWLDETDKEFKINFHGESERIFVSSADGNGWRSFVAPLGTRFKLECSYYDKNRKESTPFWTHTKFKNDDIWRVATIAYDQLESILMMKSGEYHHKYNIQLQFRNHFKKFRGNTSDLMGPIWIDGVKFMLPLEVINSNGIYKHINSYEIEQSIHNRSNVFEGRILEPVGKIIASINGNNKF